MTIEKRIDIVVDTDKADKNLEKFEDNLKKTDDTTQDLTNSLDSMTGGAVSGFKKITGSVKTAVAGFKSLKIAIAATGIGLLVIAIGAVATAFKSSEEGQNKFIKIMNQIKVVVGNVTDIISDFGLGILSAGKALVKLAKGDLKGAGEAWDGFKNKVKEATDGVKNFGSETRRELEQVRKISDDLARADRIARDLLVERAIADRDIAELREMAARRDLYNAEQRKNALIEAGNISDEIINKEIELQRIRYEAIVANNALSKSTKEDLEAEAQAKAELIRLETAGAQRRKQLSAQLVAINQQEAAARQAEISAFNKQLEEEEKSRKELNEKIIEEEKAKNEQILADSLEARRKEAEYKAQKAIEEEQMNEAVQQAKLDITNTTLNILQALLGENSKIAKGIAIAQATMNTYQGVTAALSARSILPDPFATIQRFANAAAVGVMGFMNVRNIASMDATGQSGSAGASTATTGATGSQRRSAPSFNLVSGTGTSQIAESVSRNMQPTKAYVVSSDVSTSQELDRKIVESASL